MITPEQLLTELKSMGALAAEVVTLEAEAAVDVAGESRWVLALQMAGGWIAALFLLSFVGLIASGFVREGGWLPLGLVITTCAAIGLRQAGGTVQRQFLLAFSLVGQAAVALGLEKFIHGRSDSLVFGGFEVLVFCAVPWTTHRLLAALAALAAWHSAFFRHDYGVFITACWALACWMQLAEARWRTRSQAPLLAAVATATALFCMGDALLRLASAMLLQDDSIRHAHAAAMGLVLVSLAVLGWLGRPLWQGARGAALALLMVTVAALTWRVPALWVGLVALGLGYARGRSWLLWIGGCVALAGLGRYYYDLAIDLTSKSAALALGGVLVLAFRQLVLTRRA